MNNLTFTAVDFETATYNRMICQIGIVTVKNGAISDKKSILVQPPLNMFDQATIRVHHITPQMTIDQPTFDEVWPEIEPYFVNTPVYAHNRSFDEDALYKNLNFYGITANNLMPFKCTCEAHSGSSLESLCAGFGIPYEKDKHHDALFDAECCAKFALHLLNGEEPDWVEVDKVYEQKGKQRMKQNKAADYSNRERLKGDIFQKDLSGADPTNPFYDRKVVITGNFTQERKELAKKLKSMGADINSTISKNTHFVLIGEDPGPAKLEKVDKLLHDGFHIRKLYQANINAILDGDWETYFEAKEVKKDLDFTLDHYAKHHILFNDRYNIIASRELYFAKGLAGNRDLFRQITGNLGASGDNDIYPETNICVLSDSTIKKLEEGIKDETILYIQDFYNNNKSITFDFMFLTEGEILRYCKERCDACDDKLTMELYEKYMNSISNT